MKGEEQPILIVDEGRVDFVLHDGRLAAELRAQVRKLHRLARLVFPLVGDPSCRPRDPSAARPRSRAGRSALVSKTRHAAEVRLDCASTREVFWMDWHAPKSA